MTTLTLMLLVWSFVAATATKPKSQFTCYRSWNSKMYPVWKDGDPRFRKCWSGGEITYSLKNDGPTLTGAKVTFSINLKFPQNQRVLPDGQVVWARNCTVNGMRYQEGQAVYPDQDNQQTGVFPDGTPFTRSQRKRNQYIYVWKSCGRYWQVADGPSSSLTIDTDKIPMGSNDMEVVIYHSRGRNKFIPLGYASTVFTITDQVPFTLSLAQVDDVDQSDQNFIQNRAIAFTVKLHDPSQYLSNADVCFSWDFGDSSGTLISRDLTVTHTYLTVGTFKPQVVVTASIPTDCENATAVAPLDASTAPAVIVIGTTSAAVLATTAVEGGAVVVPASDAAPFAASAQPAEAAINTDDGEAAANADTEAAEVTSVAPAGDDAAVVLEEQNPANTAAPATEADAAAENTDAAAEGEVDNTADVINAAAEVEEDTAADVTDAAAEGEVDNTADVIDATADVEEDTAADVTDAAAEVEEDTAADDTEAAAEVEVDTAADDTEAAAEVEDTAADTEAAAEVEVDTAADDTEAAAEVEEDTAADDTEAAAEVEVDTAADTEAAAEVEVDTAADDTEAAAEVEVDTAADVIDATADVEDTAADDTEAAAEVEVDTAADTEAAAEVEDTAADDTEAAAEVEVDTAADTEAAAEVEDTAADDTEAAAAEGEMDTAADDNTAEDTEAAAAEEQPAGDEEAIPEEGEDQVEMVTDPAQVPLTVARRQAPELTADCMIYRYGSLSTSVEVIQGIESVEIVEVSNVESEAIELDQSAVDVTITCQGSLPNEICTVISDADCITPIETVCNAAAPSPDCQIILRQVFNDTGVFCINVSLTNNVSFAVTSARVSVTVGSSVSPGGTTAIVLAVMVLSCVVCCIGLMYRRFKQYQPLGEDRDDTNGGRSAVTSVPLLLWNLLSRQSPGESRPLLHGRIV